MQKLPKNYGVQYFFAVSCLFLLSVNGNAETFDEWTCTEMASEKTDNQVISCGVAIGETEGEAREKALISAKREFELICESSAECEGRKTILVPLRNVCKELSNGKYKCVRGLRYTILDERKTGIQSTPLINSDSVERPRKRPVLQPKIEPKHRHDERRQLAISVGVYTLALENKFADSSIALAFNGDPGKESLAGNSVAVTVAFARRLAFKGGVYRLTHEEFENITAEGYDLLLLLGNNFDRIGSKFYIGAGYYSETWSPGEQDFEGAQFNLGIGYNWNRISLDLVVGIREPSEYSDFVSSLNSFAEIDTIAYSGSLESAIRF